MRIVVQCMLFFIFGFPLMAPCQRLITELETETALIDSVTSFPLGDSVLIGYKDGSGPRRKYNWVSAKGEVRRVTIPHEIFAAAPAGDMVNFYYFDPFDFRRLKVLQQSGYRVNELQGGIDVGGQIVGSFVKEDLFLIIFKDFERRLDVIRVQDLRIVGKRSYAISKDLIKQFKYATMIGFYPKGSWLNSFSGGSSLKIFQENGRLIIGRSERIKKENCILHLLVLDPDSNSPQAIDIPIISQGGFDFAVDLDKVFVSSILGLGISLRTYDLSTKQQVGEFTHQMEDKDGVHCITRTGRGNKIARSSILDLELKSKSQMNILAMLPSDQGILKFQFGLYLAPIPPSGVLPISIVGLAILAASAADRAANDTGGESTYFHIEIDGKQYSINGNSSNLRKRLDEYELIRAGHGFVYSIKNYASYHNGLIGIYQIEKEKRISLIAFE